MAMRKVGIAIAVVLLTPFLPGIEADAEFPQKFIQPGRGYVGSSTFGIKGEVPCTIAFILQDADGRYWATSAGHCDAKSPYPHRKVSHRVFGTWGEFVWSDDRRAVLSDYIEADVGLIYIYDAFQDKVDPSMAGWGGPSGSAPAGSMPEGALVGHTSTPLPGNDATSTGELRRTGTAKWHNETMWACTCFVEGGDSGGAFIEVATGRALGILSGRLYEESTDPSQPQPDTAAGVNFDISLSQIRAANPAYASLQLVAFSGYAPPPG